MESAENAVIRTPNTLFYRVLVCILLFSLVLSPFTRASAQEDLKTETPTTNEVPVGDTVIDIPAEEPVGISDETENSNQDNPSIINPNEDTDNNSISETEFETQSLATDEGDLTEIAKSISSAQRLVDVDEASGAASFSLPITVPAGRNGMQPDLRFSYSSQSLNNSGLLGYGWSINIPYIERINKTGTLDLYTQDYFFSSLSGELATTSEEGDFIARADDGSFLQYTYDAGSWVMVDKKGYVYKYGSTSESKVSRASTTIDTYRWMLEEIRDSNGNIVSFKYFKDEGQVYPDEITYTDTTSSTGPFSLEFEYELRADIATSSEAGFSVVTKNRINSVLIRENGIWKRKYDLNYITGDNGKRQLLESITESGKDSGGLVTELPPTVFEYKTTPTKSWSGYNPPQSFSFSEAVRQGDVNGDGLMDIVYSCTGDCTDNDDPEKIILINRGNSWESATTTGFPNVSFFQRVDSSRHPDKVKYATLVDLNGDMLSDIYDPAGSSYINNGDLTWSEAPSWTYGPEYEESVQLADINGDRLVDLVYSWKLRGTSGTTKGIKLNTGAGWSEDMPTTGLPDSEFFWKSNSTCCTDTSRGVSLVDLNGDGLADFHTLTSTALNRGNLVWEEVPGWNFTVPDTFKALRYGDINSDGLIDIISSYRESDRPKEVHVHLNQGDGWQEDFNWASNFPALFYWYPNSSQKKSRSYSMGLADFNGDGVMDIYEMGGNSIYKSSGTPTDLLSHIRTSLHGEADITYTQSSLPKSDVSLPNPNLPLTINVVDNIHTYDSVGNDQRISFEYSGGDYYYASSTERKFSGFGVIKEVEAGRITNTYYHQGNGDDTVNNENGDSYGKIGKPFKSVVTNQQGATSTISYKEWRVSPFGGGALVTASSSLRLNYDGDSDHEDNAETYWFDNFGNLIKEIDWGRVTGYSNGTFTDSDSDALTTDYTYATTTSSAITRTAREHTKDQSSATIQETLYTYDELPTSHIDKGNLTKRERRISDNHYATETYFYNPVGLVASSTDTSGNTLIYEYDAFNLYPATTTNSLGHATSYNYNYTAGKPSLTKDPNQNIFQTEYDGLGRVKRKRVPDPINPSESVITTEYDYTDNADPTKVKVTKYLDSGLHKNTYYYFDGFGRLIQAREYAEENNTYVVSDISYDGRGLKRKESLPYFSKNSSRTIPTKTGALYSTYEYDALDRILSLHTAAGTTTYSYNSLEELVTDPKGNSKRYQRDILGNLTGVSEQNGTSTYSTMYAYDASRNLKKITDALGNERSFFYDGLGRRTGAEDLHAPTDTTFGIWNYEFDDTGNITRVSDPNGQIVNTRYDVLNRVISEDFTGTPYTDVTYIFDTCLNGVGKLCNATSSNISTAYTYNPSGLIHTESKSIDSDSYLTSYTYDRQGNVISITYPDNSSVKYTYNKTGRIDVIEQKEVGGSYSKIVSNIDYGPHGLITHQVNGNGFYTDNTYDANELYRLKRKQIYQVPVSEGEVMLNMSEPHGTDSSEINLNDGHPVSESHQEVLRSVSGTVSTSSPALTGKLGTEQVFSRTENSETYLLGKTADGKEIRRLRAFGGPIYSAITSSEGETDYAIENRNGYYNKSGNVETVLSKKPGKSGLIQFNANGVKLGLTPTTVTRNSELEITEGGEGAKIYTDISNDSSTMEVSVGDGLMRKEIILKEVPAASLGEEFYKISFLLTSDKNIDLKVKDGNDRLSDVRILTTRQELEVLSDSRVVAYIYPARAEDSKAHYVPEQFLGLTVTYEKTEEGILVTKNIPYDWLIQAEYPVKADLILGAYSGAGDGSVGTQPYPAIWNAQHADTTGREVNYTGTEAHVLSGSYIYSTGWLNIDRTFLSFDTSALPDNAIVSSTTVNLYTLENYDQYNDAYSYVNISQGLQSSATSLVNADIDNCGNAITNPTIGSENKDLTGIGKNTYTSIEMNATGIGWVSKTGYTKLCLREGHDVTNNPTVNDSSSWKVSGLYIATSETAGTSKDPYLDITYTVPVTTIAPTSSAPRVNNRVNPTEIIDWTPGFSAVFTDANANDYGTDYRIQISTSSSSWSSPIWDSGKKLLPTNVANGSRSVDVQYYGTTSLATSTSYYWRIKFWDNTNLEGSWSTTTASFTLADQEKTIMDNIYSYDAVGNIVSITDISNINKAVATVYNYDDLYRLVSVATTSASVNFSVRYFDGIETIQPNSVAGKDTYYGTSYVMTGDPNGNFIRVGGWGDEYFGYLEFPMSEVPESAKISNAKLYLYNGRDSIYNAAKLLRITSPWNENDISISNNPSSYDYGMPWQEVPLNDWWVVDVTQLVKDWKDGFYSNYGIKIDALYNGNNEIKEFWSSDYPDETKRPKLVIQTPASEEVVLGTNPITLGTTTSTIEAYSYNAIGNILSKSDIGFYTYTDDGYNNPHAVSGVGSSTYTYDNNGNLTSGLGASYVWDFQNRLHGSIVGTTSSSYMYDHANARVSKIVAGVTTVYPNRYFEKSGNEISKNIYIGDDLVATIYGTGTSTASTTYAHLDHLGSTRAITNETGNKIQSITYAPFGAERENTSLGIQLQSNGYIGQNYDSESSLLYLNARYYEGSRGQFLSQDPSFLSLGNEKELARNSPLSQELFLRDPQRMNSYSYAGNNPITNKDPEGKDYLDFGVSATVMPYSGNASLKYDFQNGRLDFSYGLGLGTGASVDGSVLYSKDDLPDSTNYITQKAEGSGGYVLVGQASIETYQDTQNPKLTKPTVNVAGGLGTGVGLSGNVGVNHNITLINHSQTGALQNIIKQLNAIIKQLDRNPSKDTSSKQSTNKKQ